MKYGSRDPPMTCTYPPPLSPNHWQTAVQSVCSLSTHIYMLSPTALSHETCCFDACLWVQRIPNFFFPSTLSFPLLMCFLGSVHGECWHEISCQCVFLFKVLLLHSKCFFSLFLALCTSIIRFLEDGALCGHTAHMSKNLKGPVDYSLTLPSPPISWESLSIVKWFRLHCLIVDFCLFHPP